MLQSRLTSSAFGFFRCSKDFLVTLLLFGASTALLSGCVEKASAGRSHRAGATDGTATSPTPTLSPSPGVILIPGPSPFPSGTPTPNPMTTPSPDQACYKADKFICEIELAIARKTNEKRGSASPFTFSKKLGYAARVWSQSQGERKSIGHAGFPNARMTTLKAEFTETSSVRMSAENVAMTGASKTDAEAVADAFIGMWWNSSGHRRNMLGNYAAIGVGVYRLEGSGSYYATQIFGQGD